MASGNVIARIPITQWVDEDTGKRVFSPTLGQLTFPPGVDKAYVARIQLGDLLGGGGGLTVEFGFSSDRASGGNARFAVMIKALASGTDTLGGVGSGGGTEIPATAAAPTADGQFRSASIALSNAEADAVAANGYLEIRLKRTGSHASDTHGDGRIGIVTDIRIKQT